MGSRLLSHLPSRRLGQQPEWGLWCKLMENGTWLPHRGSSPRTAVCAPPSSLASDTLAPVVAQGSRPAIAGLAPSPEGRYSGRGVQAGTPVLVPAGDGDEPGPRSRAGVERGAGVLASAPSASPSLEFDQVQIALCSERRAFLGI